jgi:hypothetical protein
MPENWPQGALIVLGASEEQIPLYREARCRQIPTIAVDMRSDAPAFGFADATLPISTRDTDAITDALGDVRPAGIVCGASDAALASWHALALQYGTAYVYPQSALAAGDKAASTRSPRPAASPDTDGPPLTTRTRSSRRRRSCASPSWSSP